MSYLLKQGAKIAEVPVHIAERAGGESYLKPMVAVRYMARMLLSILLIQNFRNGSAMRRDRQNRRYKQEDGMAEPGIIRKHMNNGV